jgi:hypothetical protein
MRTETLLSDWVSLLTDAGLPLQMLPKSNPSNAAPRTIFTQRVVDIIQRVDAPMFLAPYDYALREAPFELGHI